MVTPVIHRVTRTPRKPQLTGLAPHLAALVQDTVSRDPQAEAIADLGTGRRLRYADLWDEASRVAGGLLAAGVRPGGRVAIRLPNGADWCLAFLGVTLAGAIPVPVNTRLTPTEVEFIVRDSGASAVLDGRLPDGPPAAPADPDSEAPAAIFYTSGTTGRPKGTVLSHQLLVRGPQVMSGYWQRPEATAAATSGGWLHTGDLVSVDPAGRVRILDRRTDLINRGGENVYSIEVERVLSRHPGVAEVAVVGVPDPMMGSKVGAVVVPRAGETVEPLDLVRVAREELADFKVPQYVLFRTEALPRNPGGKVDKATLRARPDWGTALW